jgi:PAS domain S-box-containing protein
MPLNQFVTSSDRALKAEFHLILNAVVEGICGLDARGNATFCNDALLKMLGYQAEEIVGKNVHKLLHPSRTDQTGCQAEECTLRKAMDSNQATQIAGEFFWRKDGTCFPTECRMRPLQRPSSLTCQVLTVNDITAVRQASVAYALLSKIPRLEPIAWMIEHQNRPVPPGESEMSDMRLGAEILRLILAYEQAIHKGISRTEAAHVLARQNRNFSPQFFQALVTLDPNAEEGETWRCRIEDLSPSMIIQQEVRSFEGALLVSKGQEVTPTVIFKLNNFHARRLVGGDVMVSKPRTTLAFGKHAP